jgi:hypothetical protein
VIAWAADDEAALIEAIYDAALDPAVPVPWHFHGFDAKIFEAYNDYYHHVDVYRHGLVISRD